jgi:hypothetical protein
MIRNPSTGDTLCSQWFANLDDKRSQLLESFAGDLIGGDWSTCITGSRTPLEPESATTIGWVSVETAIPAGRKFTKLSPPPER